MAAPKFAEPQARTLASAPKAKAPHTKAATAKKKPAVRGLTSLLPTKPARTPLPKPAAPPVLSQEQVDTAIKSLPVQFLQCRDFGHTWRPLHARWVPQDNRYEAELKCPRCKTIRTRYLSSRGELLTNKYEYEDGYQMPKGMGRLEGEERDLIRLTSIQSILVVDTVAEEE
jgi:hypothetical protein